MTTELDILKRLPSLLAEQTGLPVNQVERPGQADIYLQVGQHLFVVEAMNQSQAGRIENAAQQAKREAHCENEQAVPLLAVPFMGELGQSICKKVGVSYIDLSGNADIQAPGLRIRIAGLPNRFIKRGRPSSVFAPKSSRISRLLLLEPRRWWRQSELSEQAKLGRGYVSKICKRMEEDHLLDRAEDGSLRPRDPDLLLDAWKARYDFNRHDIRPGHVPARSGEEFVARLADACDNANVRYALTGLSAAWLYAPFAAFRLVTVYVGQYLDDDFLSHLDWSEESRGANLWLISPNDEGVWDGAQQVKSLNCVSSVQTYLDLQTMPERSEEAAEQLRKDRMQWR